MRPFAACLAATFQWQHCCALRSTSEVSHSIEDYDVQPVAMSMESPASGQRSLAAVGAAGDGEVPPAWAVQATSQTSISVLVRERVRAWFTVIESELGAVDYARALNCSADDVPYINLVVHVKHGSWSVVCGSLSGARGEPLADILNKVAPLLPTVDVLLPFGLHDGVQKRSEAENQHVPVLGAAYHKRYSQVSLPFAMGCIRARNGYVNTPVVGWDKYVKTWFTCSSAVPSIKKAVFRGKAGHRAQKYGACTNACSWKDNGRLYVHSLGQEYPLLFDTAATNANRFRAPLPTPKQRANASLVKQQIPFPDQLCNYQAILNIGNNLDWAERLRQSFYGNAVIMLPEDPPHEFFNSFMEPYVHYWPLKPDLSDVVEQVQRVFALPNVTQQLRGQRSFAGKFLTENFMLFYNRIVIEEYDRRARMFRARTWTAPTRDERERAKQLLRLRGCETHEFTTRSCPAGGGPA